jgi:hypothetical protein
MWWWSVGVFFVIAMFHGPSLMNGVQLRYFIPSAAVWFVGNYVIYQRWQLDNTKMFNAAWMPIAFASASFYLTCLSRQTIGRVLACILMFFSCLSGLLAAKMAVVETYELWEHDDFPIELADFAKANSDPKSIWILDDWHAHPVTILAGRQSVLGYGGWTSSHGLSEALRKRMIGRLAVDPDDVRESDEFGVQFVCVRERAKNRIVFPVGINSTKWTKVFENRACRVYRRTATDDGLEWKGGA